MTRLREQITALIMGAMIDGRDLSPSERETMASAQAEYIDFLYRRSPQATDARPATHSTGGLPPGVVGTLGTSGQGVGRPDDEQATGTRAGTYDDGINDALQAIRDERLTDNTGDPLDEAYNQALTDAAIAVRLKAGRE